MAIYSLDEARLHWPAEFTARRRKIKMMRYRLWSLAAILLLMSLGLVACTGNPGGPNTNSAGTKATEPAQNKNASNAGAGAAQSAIGYEGFQDDINCYNLIGWAWDAQHPNDAVKVE